MEVLDLIYCSPLRHDMMNVPSVFRGLEKTKTTFCDKPGDISLFFQSRSGEKCVCGKKMVQIEMYSRYHWIFFFVPIAQKANYIL